jgi:prephenate dehydrogenase
MKVAIIGIGLIGGSIAKDLRSSGFAKSIIGVEANPIHGEVALEKGLVNELMSLDNAIESSDILILSTPVEVSKLLLPQILDSIGNKLVIDVCSTKKSITSLVEKHINRGQYVAAHPMSGTEYSGPMAAVDGLFINKTNIICEKEKSKDDVLKLALSLFDTLQMKTSFMESDEHDVHAANVSHLSHISSFALALSVLEIEKENPEDIKIMAAGGFRSTVRLAKSDARTWEDILLDNSVNVLTALNVYEKKLKKFKEALITQDKNKLNLLIQESNKIGPIVDAIAKSAEEK